MTSPRGPVERIVSLHHCPDCGIELLVQNYGPFFTPEPEHRWAMTCPAGHWRGPMSLTPEEAQWRT
jgi:hypothetical protein